MDPKLMVTVIIVVILMIIQTKCVPNKDKAYVTMHFTPYNKYRKSIGIGGYVKSSPRRPQRPRRPRKYPRTRYPDYYEDDDYYDNEGHRYHNDHYYHSGSSPSKGRCNCQTKYVAIEVPKKTHRRAKYKRGPNGGNDEIVAVPIETIPMNQNNDDQNEEEDVERKYVKPKHKKSDKMNGLATCPPPYIDITPCECIEDQTSLRPSVIRCTGDQPLDLITVFDILDANVGPGNRNFDIFYLNNTSVDEIPENNFREFTFSEIYFEKLTKLSKIDSKVFQGLERHVKYIHIRDTKLNLNSNNDSDISCFDGLENLELLDFSTTECPPNGLLGPKCKCELLSDFDDEMAIRRDSTVITCQQISNSEELFQVFDGLNNHLKDNKRNYFRFRLIESKVNELPENLFNEITFSEILIQDCPELSSINGNVFSSIAPFINKLMISNINLENNTQNIEDVWQSISSLKNLVRLELVNVFNEIPKNAFKVIGNQTQTRLKFFSHLGFEAKGGNTARIKSIGRYAFYHLPNIQVINLQNNLIERIDKYSFANQISSDKQLLIRLAKNRLNSVSFSMGSLAGSQRPIRLELGQMFVGCNREITYLEESVFSPFLDRAGNELEMGCSFPMECECHMKWLYDGPVFWRHHIRSGQFGDTVIPCQIDTEDGVEELSIWDLPEDYFGCQPIVVYNNDTFDSVININNSVENEVQEFIDDAIDLIV